MIDFGKILKRAWSILWDYKVLWIFGILLALTTGGGNGGNNSNYRMDQNQIYNGNNYDPSQVGPLGREFMDWFTQDVAPVFEHPSEHVATLIWIGVVIFLFILIVSIIGAFIRYPSEVAVMRMVDGYEANGEKVGFRAGWKLGWNRRAFRLWVVDLVLSLPALVFVALLVMLAVGIYFNTADATPVTSTGLLVTLVGCTFLLVFSFIIFMVFLTLLREFFARFVALEETGVSEAFSRGWAFFKHNWKSAGLMWLIMLGIGIGVAIAGIILFVLLVPVYLVLLIPALLVAAVPGLIAYGIASIFFSSPIAILIGVIFALPIFLTILFAPLFLFSGWYQIYRSNVWTLTYREMKALNAIPATPAPDVLPPTV